MPPRRRAAVRRFRASPKLRKTEAALSRARSKMRSMRRPGGDAEKALTQAAGGALAAVAETYSPALPGNIDPRLAVGSLLVASAAMGWVKGKNAERATLVGGGILACWTQDLVGGIIATT